ncbi:hypothetical protein HN832_04785 [archaeon]|jgi:ribosome biogenesis GTPase A|nr:hypothetical protein [archaeon]MBT4374003.1 hypothetical protein [archaeon]MBT4532099.1 hypothetical protein [archaeon]MBT7001989.1 hypothetical protein [archaeon]MBT7282700.1 hypothetical protein [archaeon]
MRPKYIFSSRHTRRARNKFTTSKSKFPEILKKVIQNSDIIIQVLDARFPEDTRNLEVEKKIEAKEKKLIYVLNKSDMVSKKQKHQFKPYIYISSTKRKGSKDLRNQIKIQAKKIKKPVEENKIYVGIIGYPNTGKSSLINLLIGKTSAGTGAEAGFTKGVQKLKLSENLYLLDSPGVIPEEEYSAIKKDAIAKHVKVSARGYSQVKEPELIISELMKDYAKQIEAFYKIKSKGDVEILLEELGKQKNFLKKGGEINEDQTARLIIKDWQEGKIKI